MAGNVALCIRGAAMINSGENFLLIFLVLSRVFKSN